MRRATRRRAALISAGLLFSAATAHAVDGVIEINQASALARAGIEREPRKLQFRYQYE